MSVYEYIYITNNDCKMFLVKDKAVGMDEVVYV